jgi:hypothetical protein
VAGFEYPPKCDFKMADGTDCPVPASHLWGSLGESDIKPVAMCCTHFDQFALELLRTEQPVYQPSHLEIIQEYDRKCKRPSVIPGAQCKADKSGNS